jgi:nitrite reductase/ring-hydroxylating ferredoxin subunit
MSEDEKTRRHFLQTGGCLVVALAAAGLSAEALSASPIAFVTGRGAGALKSYPIPAADSVNIDRDAQIIVVRNQNRAFAFALSCPHQNAAVRWVENEHRFACTKHDSKYQPDGVYTSGRATRNMDRCPIKRDGPALVVDIAQVFHSDSDPKGWAAAFVTL